MTRFDPKISQPFQFQVAFGPTLCRLWSWGLEAWGPCFSDLGSEERRAGTLHLDSLDAWSAVVLGQWFWGMMC